MTPSQHNLRVPAAAAETLRFIRRLLRPAAWSDQRAKRAQPLGQHGLAVLLLRRFDHSAAPGAWATSLAARFAIAEREPFASDLQLASSAPLRGYEARAAGWPASALASPLEDQAGAGMAAPLLDDLASLGWGQTLPGAPSIIPAPPSQRVAQPQAASSDSSPRRQTSASRRATGQAPVLPSADSSQAVVAALSQLQADHAAQDVPPRQAAASSTIVPPVQVGDTPSDAEAATPVAAVEGSTRVEPVQATRENEVAPLIQSVAPPVFETATASASQPTPTPTPLQSDVAIRHLSSVVPMLRSQGGLVSEVIATPRMVGLRPSALLRQRTPDPLERMGISLGNPLESFVARTPELAVAALRGPGPIASATETSPLTRQAASTGATLSSTSQPSHHLARSDAAEPSPVAAQPPAVGREPDSTPPQPLGSEAMPVATTANGHANDAVEAAPLPPSPSLPPTAATALTLREQQAAASPLPPPSDAPDAQATTQQMVEVRQATATQRSEPISALRPAPWLLGEAILRRQIASTGRIVQPLALVRRAAAAAPGASTVAPAAAYARPRFSTEQLMPGWSQAQVVRRLVAAKPATVAPQSVSDALQRPLQRAANTQRFEPQAAQTTGAAAAWHRSAALLPADVWQQLSAMPAADLQASVDSLPPNQAIRSASSVQVESAVDWEALPLVRRLVAWEQLSVSQPQRLTTQLAPRAPARQRFEASDTEALAPTATPGLPLPEVGLHFHQLVAQPVMRQTHQAGLYRQTTTKLDLAAPQQLARRSSDEAPEEAALVSQAAQTAPMPATGKQELSIDVLVQRVSDHLRRQLRIDRERYGRSTW